jgi:hypothetical protein
MARVVYSARCKVKSMCVHSAEGVEKESSRNTDCNSPMIVSVRSKPQNACYMVNR